MNLAYKLRLYPTVNKADTLALLSSLFRRAHADCTTHLRQEEGRHPSTQGMGEFIGRAYRRAWIDYDRITKAGHTPGALQAELLEAEMQYPKRATHFDYWVMVKGTGDKAFRIPARSHHALNRTLALPGARLNIGSKSCATVMRKNGKWYVYVSVTVPVAEVQKPHGWVGCDIGARAAVTRSDGYRGPDLRPLFDRDDERKQNHAKQGRDRSRPMSPSRQVIAREARNAVTVCLRSGRGIALEDPKRLIRWKKHASRFFGQRVLLLAAIYGLAVCVISPPYTSTTCARCGHIERRQRQKGTFHCWHCHYLTGSDFNAALNICHKAYAVTGVSHGSLSLSPGGVDADE